MSRFSSDTKSRTSKKAKAILREMKGGKPAEHLGPIEPIIIMTVQTEPWPIDPLEARRIWWVEK